MGIFSQYNSPRKDKHGMHPHNITHKVIMAHSGETITIEIPNNNSGSRPHEFNKEINSQPQRMNHQKYNEHSGKYTSVFGHKIEYRNQKHKEIKREAASRYAVRETSHISHELKRRRNERVLTLSDYVNR